ncbi:hypothetical protein [Catellatospora sichuanensis]|uniref:hypothetical protein n=1 Tax=Catellatospora sichuanensis TaxID=1969805 RepID=UPI001183E94C|nr:hypothetical protein [Catellatospora sichuanensis]
MLISKDEIAAMRAKPAYVAGLYLGRLSLIPGFVFVRELVTHDRRTYTLTAGIAFATQALLMLFAYLYGNSARPVRYNERSGRLRTDATEGLDEATFIDFFVLWRPRPLPEGHAHEPTQDTSDVADPTPRPLRKRLGHRR